VGGGTAIFMVEGQKFEIALANFATAQIVCGMLETAFDSGKSFAAQQVVASFHTNNGGSIPPRWPRPGGIVVRFDTAL